MLMPLAHLCYITNMPYRHFLCFIITLMFIRVINMFQLSANNESARENQRFIMMKNYFQPKIPNLLKSSHFLQLLFNVGGLVTPIHQSYFWCSM